MIDLAYIREHLDEIKAAVRDLNSSAPLDEIVELDERRRAMLSEIESLRAERNRVSREIPRIKDAEEKAALITQMRGVGDRIAELEKELDPVQERLQQALLEVPNLPDPSVPVGPDESHNVVVRQVGELPTFDFEPLPHWDLGETLGIIDFERGVKISGSRFYILKGAGARLQRALISWMIDVHTQYHGYTEVYPPYLVRPECLVGTGQLPKFAENLYYDTEDDLWMVPTAEVPVTNLYRDEILSEEQLPIYHTAYTACFRREKMSAGKDTRGIKRGHQFDKVEMVKFVKPETSMAELESLIDNAEDICRRLELPYRIVQMCTGDLSFSASAKYDVELWAAGCREWLEVSSCSNFKDFQARRANIRYRPAGGGRPEFVHTLNGSGLALPRLVIAVLENYQQADGTVRVPEVLQPYMGGLEVIR
ncbi:MAG TPA: serine--tRNA ligase [Chloroflexi bacterium]|nr:serine--tRNA ligase [Chloroflexota bacterium]